MMKPHPSYQQFIEAAPWPYGPFWRPLRKALDALRRNVLPRPVKPVSGKIK